MATIWVRYRNGQTDAWRLTDALALDLKKFALDLMHSSAVREVIHFPVVSRDEEAADFEFGFASLRTEDVIAWHLEGLVNAEAAASLWAEMEGPPESQ